MNTQQQITLQENLIAMTTQGRVSWIPIFEDNRSLKYKATIFGYNLFLYADKYYTGEQYLNHVKLFIKEGDVTIVVLEGCSSLFDTIELEFKKLASIGIDAANRALEKELTMLRKFGVRE